MATTRVTVLVENTAQGAGLMGEHGLAYWIEQEGHQFMFDAGQGGVLKSNAIRLGIRLAEIEALILSHGHYDHTGGASSALNSSLSAAVYVHPAAFARKYTRNGDGAVRDIGIPHLSEETIRNPRYQVISTTEPTCISGNLTVTGYIPRVTDFEDTGGAFHLDQACTQSDPLEDDQSVFFDTKEGTVVLLGCAHSGIINTLRYIRQLTNNRPLYMVIGGTHLVNAKAERTEQTIQELRELGSPRLAPAHCTGMKATLALWNAFPGKCQSCPVGTRFEFE